MRPPESSAELVKFCQYIKSLTGEDPITLVEVGSYMGESSAIFAREFKNGKIICIDPWTSGFDDNDATSGMDFIDVEQQFDLRAAMYKNIVKVKDFSINKHYVCDIVYIDGCHTYDAVKEDIKHWLPQTKKIISGHDYYNDEVDKRQPHTAGVRKAVDEVLGIPDKVFADGSWVKKI